MSSSSPTTVASPTILYGRTLTLARTLWAALVGLLLLTFVSGLPATYADALNMLPETRAALQNARLPETFPALFLSLVDTLMMLSFAVVCITLVIRRSNDWMAMFVSLTLLLTAGIYTYPIYKAPLLIAAFLVGLGETCQVIFFYVFPDGRWLPRWGKWLILPLLLTRIGIWAVVTLPRYYASGLQTAEGFGRISQDAWDIAMVAGLVVLGIISQVYRYRSRSTPAQRQQVKWLLIGFTAAVSVITLYVFTVNVFGLVSADPRNAFFSIAIARLIRHIALFSLPITLSISILRYRLLDVDLIINRGLVYGALTVLYIVLVIGSQQILAVVSGGEQNGLAIALSTAVLAALFQPLRSRVQKFVDRRFYARTHETHKSSMPVTEIRPSSGIVGQHLGPYEVIEPIAKGGMGEVYRARHTALHRYVAVKLLPEIFSSEEEFRARFEREAQIVAALRHPNIVGVFDFGTFGSTPYMVMEYIDGIELKDHLHSKGRLPLDEALPLIRDIASALDYAHEQRMVHRDVKPSNVMLQRVTMPDGDRLYRAILMDFGIAKMVAGETQLTRTGTVGTLDYMSPEQITASSEVDKRTDIYALGAMVYQMLTGELPFKGDNPGQIIFGHLQAPVPNPLDVVPDLPPYVAEALMRAMAKQPDDRFQSAGAFAEALSNYLW